MTDMKKTDDLVDDANQSKLESKPVHDIGDIRNKNNRMRSGFLFGLMAVLVIGIFALKTYKNYFADDQQKASESTGDTSISQVSKIRTWSWSEFWTLLRTKQLSIQALLVLVILFLTVIKKCHRRGSGNICQYLLLVREGVRLARVAAAGHRRHQSHRKKGKNQKKMCLVNQE